MKKRLGFTLAEVLITLGIIGVVAAMTIPTLMNSTGEAQFKAGLKKSVAVLNQAITMTVALDSVDFSSLTSGALANTTSILNMFGKRTKYITAAPGSNTFDAMGSNFNAAGRYVVFFQDGSAISWSTAAGTPACTAGAPCSMVVDVNGLKGPNVLSTATNEATKAGIKDQFNLQFFDQQVIGADDAANYALYN